MQQLPFRRPSVAVWTLAVIAALVVPLSPPAAAQVVSQATIVSDNPANYTPNVLDGRVNTFAEVGQLIIAGGSFTQVQAAGSATTLARSNVLAFAASDGAISTTFAPNVAGEVYDVEPAGDGTSVYVVGSFTQVNGTTTSRIARLNVTTGAKVSGFNSPTFNGVIKNVDLVNGRLLVGGSFSTVGGQSRSRLASLDPTTGALTSFLNLAVAGANNGGGTQVLKMEVSPNGQRLVIVGNFTSVAGATRLQIAMIDLTGATAVLSSWATGFFTNSCASVFNTYMRDLDFSPDSSYFVVSTTGAYRGATSPCDVITRWETAATGPGQEATWRDYTGGDTSYAVAITGAAVYVGGHMRWMNNPYAGDQAGPGAVPREGIAALDPVSGLPLSWNPGRARGVGVFDMLATSTGLWVGSDTDQIGGETRRKIAFFPLAGGTTPPPQVLSTLPGDVYLLGGTAGSADPGVLYRVNAGGPALQSVDDGPDWEADAGTASPYRNSGSNSASSSGNGTISASVPNSSNDRAPGALFAVERWDPTGDPEMQWNFPVPEGTAVTVRLYLSNRCSCTSNPGQRVFNVSVEGSTVLPNLDLVSAYGHEVGVMEDFDVISDGTITIDFGHVVENPLINGIEIVLTGSQPGGGGGSADAASRRSFDGASAGAPVAVPGTSWGNTRGAFLVDNTLYAGQADGTMTRRTFNAATSTFGAPSVVDLYGGSFGTDVGNLTGMAYSDGRLYYTLFGDNTMHWRWFSPESHVVGATPFNVSGNGGLTLSDVRGMFLSGTTLYVADRATGDLVQVSLSGTSLSGPPVVANSAVDWQARGLFLAGEGAPPPPPNQPPMAQASVTCDDLTCEFSSAGSSDPEGQALTYAWSFSDGGTSTLANPSHTFASEGDYSASLIVTDNRGDTGTASTGIFHVTAPPPTAPVAAFSASCGGLSCTFTNTSTAAASSSWDFGDGDTSTVTSPSHTYPGAGTFSVTLTVNGPGGNDDVSQDVTVAPSSSTISFRGAGTAVGNATTFTVPTPTGVESGDVLLLFVTSARGTTPANPPSGWTFVASQADGTDMRTTLYRRVGTTGGMGTVSWSAVTKTNLTVLAYSGAEDVPSIIGSAAKTTAASTSYTTPVVPIDQAGSTVVSFWALRGSTSATWEPPAGTVERADSSGTGSGTVSGSAADQVGAAAGTSTARTATASVSSAKATTWTVVLAPS